MRAEQASPWNFAGRKRAATCIEPEKSGHVAIHRCVQCFPVQLSASGNHPGWTRRKEKVFGSFDFSKQTRISTGSIAVPSSDPAKECITAEPAAWRDR